MPTLAGKTIFISGASRGIGLAIALRAARDGANIVIAAKTDAPHPKLPGTIHTAAAEIEAAGGHALPLAVDIRFEDQVHAAVEKAVTALRRHRYSGQQCQRHQPDRYARDTHEALRSDDGRESARHVCLFASLPAAPGAMPPIRIF